MWIMLSMSSGSTNLKKATDDVELSTVVPLPSTVILGTLGLTFSGWLLKRKRMV
jgi:hypothetical protein